MLDAHDRPAQPHLIGGGTDAFGNGGVPLPDLSTRGEVGCCCARRTPFGYRSRVADDQSTVNPYELARALLGNAEQLVADAELLLEHGRHPRAAALSLMALEEMSKIQFCVDSIVDDTPVPGARSKEWTNHKDKFTGVKALELAFVEESPQFDRARIRSSVLEDQGTKLASLYVDHTDGEIATPATNKVDAPRLVERARATVDWLGRMVPQLTPEAMEEIRPYREVIEQFLSATIDENDMEGSVERLRAIMAAGLAISAPQTNVSGRHLDA